MSNFEASRSKPNYSNHLTCKILNHSTRSDINALHGVVIGDCVQIGSHCSIYSVSTIDKKEGEVRLEKGCSIGTHSVVMPGVSVGENSVVGAFSFVNSDIPANVVAVGVPARVIRQIDK